MMMRTVRITAVFAVICGLVLAGLMLVNSSALAEANGVETAVSGSFSYQGRLQRQGAPLNGSCSLQFTLWDAASGGTQKGTRTLNNVAVTEGLFAVELDFGDAFWGDARWLETVVQCPGDGGFTSLGREELTAVPYALGLRPGSTVRNFAGNGLTGISHTEAKAGLVGLNMENGYGVYGSSINGSGIFGRSDNWIGVYGQTMAAGSAGAAGVWGRAGSAGGVGVVGQAVQPDSIGVKGVAHESGGVGVWGQSNKNTGVYGQSTNWVGVWGVSQDASGVYGVSSAQYSAGVYGQNKGKGFGVYGTAIDNAGVVGISENWTGVYGRSTNGLAGDFDGRLRAKVVQITGGSDLAERFAVSGDETIEPGTVMVIDPDNPGHLMPSSGAYDRKVAGVVSGAGGVNPGLTLHQEGVLEGDAVVAIAGRVYVLADASNGAIEPGDLLTTSDLPGHVMKATDLDLAQGAILGKAMTALDSDTGLVLVLVNLQ